jgi:hypothetical protein
MGSLTEKVKNYGMTAQLMEQAAKECGDAYTNKQKVEHSGGVPVSSVTSVIDEIGDEDLQVDKETAECLREFRLNIYRWQAWYKASL